MLYFDEAVCGFGETFFTYVLWRGLMREIHYWDGNICVGVLYLGREIVSEFLWEKYEK